MSVGISQIDEQGMTGTVPSAVVGSGAPASDESRVRFWVDDEGPGIPASDRDRVWEPYVRLNRAVESATGGSGIGLSVVRELVTLHGGAAWIEAAPANGGARVVVELPVRALAADASVPESTLEQEHAPAVSEP